jgi:hypothetical protein
MSKIIAWSAAFLALICAVLISTHDPGPRVELGDAGVSCDVDAGVDAIPSAGFVPFHAAIGAALALDATATPAPAVPIQATPSGDQALQVDPSTLLDRLALQALHAKISA